MVLNSLLTPCISSTTGYVQQYTGEGNRRWFAAWWQEWQSISREQGPIQYLGERLWFNHLPAALHKDRNIVEDLFEQSALESRAREGGSPHANLTTLPLTNPSLPRDPLYPRPEHKSPFSCPTLLMPLPICLLPNSAGLSSTAKEQGHRAIHAPEGEDG